MLSQAKSKLKEALKYSSLVVQNYYKKTSYSQSGEDLIVKFIFDMMGIKTPSYIDIGAHHPFSINNTFIFYRSGSTGINIEPDVDLFKNFSRFRKKDKNLNFGVGAANGVMTFYVMSSRGLNTFSAKDAREAIKEGYRVQKEVPVSVRTVPEIISEYCQGIFPDFLSIDVEGFDLEILKSIDFSKSKPKVICVETLSFTKDGTGQKHLESVDWLKRQGYFVYADTYINTIVVLKEAWDAIAFSR